MEKERIDVFCEERKRLEAGVSGASGIRRTGRAMARTAALGTAIFALIFILCCFFVGFGVNGGAGLPVHGGTAVTTSEVTAPPTAAGSPDNAVSSAVTSTREDGLLALLHSLIGRLSGGGATSAGDTTVPTPVTAVPPSLPAGFDIYAFDYALVPPGETAIVPMDMSLSSYGEDYIYNDTSYAPKLDALLDADTLPAFDYINAAVYPVGDPVVLIIHTHGTEAYSPEGSISYDGKGELARSTDITENVVAVGAVIAEVLNSNGIKTLHSTVMHDRESYRDSYIRSASTIKEYLSKYPSIKYVIDVHRDSLTTSSGSLIRPVTVADGRAAAQVMCVVGSDYGGADYPGWQDNLSFALKLRSSLNEKYGGICRPVYLRSSAYNQQYARLSMLLEVGTSGNYLSEAKEAARLVAGTLAQIIKN